MTHALPSVPRFAKRCNGATLGRTGAFALVMGAMASSPQAQNAAKPKSEPVKVATPAGAGFGGAIATGTELLPVAGTACKAYFPSEILGNPAILKRLWPANEWLVDVQRNYKCNAAGLLEVEATTLYFATRQKTREGKLAKPRPYLEVIFSGKLVAGRPSGKMGIQFKPGGHPDAPPESILADKWQAHLKERNKEALARGCAMFTCDGLGIHGYYRNGKLFFSEAEYGRPQREAAAQAARQEEDRRKPIRDKRVAAMSAGKCDEVKTLDDELKEARAYPDCLQKLGLSADNPRAMFVNAGKLEALGERGKAKAIYSAILDRYPNDDLAIKATEWIGAIGDAARPKAKAR